MERKLAHPNSILLHAVTRKSVSPGRPTEKVLELPIKPGFKAGTRITFSGEGDEIEPGLAEDLVFVIREVSPVLDFFYIVSRY